MLTVALVVLSACFGATNSAVRAGELVEPPALAEEVAAGRLPPLAERLPAQPMVMNVADAGRHGGSLRMLFARAKDIRIVTVYSYARLVRYNEDLEIVPDIAEAVEVEEGRSFTIRIRAGHKWSDGQPFTSEDFRYYWEDMATNAVISPLGPESMLVVDGKPATFEVIDERTVRYTWEKPNPYFLPALAAPRPPFIYRPAHYLRQFHERYAPADRLAALVAEHSQRDWRALHYFMDKPYTADNIAFPSLQPWVNTTNSPSERFIFKRNPYFHRVDQNGRQLPYLDQLVAGITSGDLIPAKVGTGDADLQARGLEFKNYTFLKNGEDRNGYDVRLWRTAQGARVALFPNLHVSDPVQRTLARDVRFRRALSLAIDRGEINQTLFFGLAEESNNTVIPDSPLFKDEYQSSWATYDIDEANRLLDEIGLVQRDGEGYRLMSDGRRLEIIVETAGEDQEQTDVLQLVRDTWRKAGIALFIKPSRREVMRDHAKSGTAWVTIFYGIDNGLAGPDTAPIEFVPTSEDQLQWPLWGRYYETAGKSGEAPDMPEGQKLAMLHERWASSLDSDERETIWHDILATHAENVFTIGVVCRVPQPVVVSRKLHNVPEDGIYSWDPGAHFGLYSPDTFWMDQ
ncbi:MAG: ABC transporter substrate-binding protein [Rhizobiales bacterium]|nr:ABC transporter substrate-binding protein [Hyphomicrobiales bacterium]